MRKPQITRIKSQLRQARNRAARRCSEHINEPALGTNRLQFNSKPEKGNRADQDMLLSDREQAT